MMRVQYLGNRNELTRGQRHRRMADISYDEDRERGTVERIADLMRDLGWEIDTSVEGWGGCRVDDREEFNEFMRDWKRCKKEVMFLKRREV